MLSNSPVVNFPLISKKAAPSSLKIGFSILTVSIQPPMRAMLGNRVADLSPKILVQPARRLPATATALSIQQPFAD